MNLDEVQLPPGCAPLNTNPAELRVRFQKPGTNPGDEPDDWTPYLQLLSRTGDLIQLTVPFAAADKPQAEWAYEFDYQITIFISSHRDHLTLGESRAEPDPIIVDLPHNKHLPARHLPDLSMHYLLAQKEFGDPSPMPSSKSVFTSAGSVSLPWSPQYRIRPGFPKNLPVVSLSPGLMVQQDFAVVEIDLPAGESMGGEEFYDLLRKQYVELNDWDCSGAAYEVQVLPFPLPVGGDRAATALVFGGSSLGDVPLDSSNWKTVLPEADPIDRLNIVEENDMPHRQTLRIRLLKTNVVIDVVAPELPVPLRHDLSTVDKPWAVQFRVRTSVVKASRPDPLRLFVRGERNGTQTRELQLQPSPP